MDVKRYFRGPLLLIVAAAILLLVVLDYANSGQSYKQTKTSRVVSFIQAGDVKSAILIDKDQTIEITTKSGSHYQASWVGNQGQALQQQLQTQVQKGSLSDYNIEVPKGNSLLSLIIGILPFALIFLFVLFMLNQMQGGGSRVMNFGKSRAKLITKDTPIPHSPTWRAPMRRSRSCRR